MNWLSVFGLVFFGAVVGSTVLVVFAAIVAGKRAENFSERWLTYEQYLELIEEMARREREIMEAFAADFRREIDEWDERRKNGLN